MKIDIRNQFIVKEIFVHDVARAVEDEDLMEECEAYLERFMTYLRNHGYLD